MNDIPISKDRFRRAILCSLSLLGQGRPELRCGTGTVRCLDSAVTLACLLILSTPKITFFSDRTSLAIPSAFVRLGSFKRWPRYHTARSRQTLFSKIFTIVCNPLPRNKIKIHFFSRFPLPAPPIRPLPHPSRQQNQHRKLHPRQNHNSHRFNRNIR